MTTAQPRQLSRALITATLAFLATLASFSATTTPTRAATAGVYSASLATPLAAARREIIDGAVWRCEGDRCSAPADGGRAMPVCSKVARKFGQVARFASPQGELNAEQLARCNGSS